MLIVTIGPPGSRKTSITAGLGRRRGRDLYREQLGIGGNADVNGADVEDRITAAQLRDVTADLEAGRDVVVDDTTQHQEHLDRWVTLAERLSVRLVVVDFRGVPLPRCIADDLARRAAGGRYVGEAAIRRVAERCAAVVIPAEVVVPAELVDA